MSFEDEQADDSTMVWPGMHKSLENWFKGLVERSDYRENLQKHVFYIRPHYITAGERKAFGSFQSRPVQKGGALFFNSSIPYGHSRAKHKRKMVFSWFLEMLEGEEYFELLEAGDPKEVMQAHQSHRSPTTYPTGMPNKGFALPSPFYSTPALTGLGAISDALLGRRPYTDGFVSMDLRSLFAMDRESIVPWVRQWRENAVYKFFEAFRILCWVEACDNFDYDPNRDRSYFRSVSLHERMKELPPDDTLEERSLSKADRECAYPEQPPVKDSGASSGRK